MGIVHFAPVGTSPGAVTSALAYLKHHEDKIKGGNSGRIIESLVLFCSPDVECGDRPADDYCWNDYGRPNMRQGWQRPKGAQNVVEVIRDFLAGEGLLEDKSCLYVWPVNVHDYQTSLDAVAKATLAVARADDTGKQVWANLTGGTNVLNAALMQVASLSGLIRRMYYTFIARDSDRRYLQPFSSDRARFDFVWLPLVKTTFDSGYYRVLEILQDGEWRSGQKLLERLKNDKDPTIQQTFVGVEPDHFKNQYLNRMAGDVLDEERGEAGEQDRKVRINERGLQILEYILLNELVEALVHREKANPDLVETCRDELAKYRC